MSNSFPCEEEESPEITFIAEEPKKKSRWSLLRNVWKAINLFRYQEAHPITADDICLEIRRIPTDKSYRNRKESDYANSPYAIALNDLKRQSRFFDCIERGAQEDIDTIMELIDNDPYKAILGERHPFSFVNKPNNNGETPLYVAARNGYREIVGLLLEKGADHLLLSGVENEVETALEVACRWGHMEVVKVLLRNNWPMEYLERAANCASNLVIKKAILNKPSLVGKICKCLNFSKEEFNYLKNCYDLDKDVIF